MGIEMISGTTDDANLIAGASVFSVARAKAIVQSFAEVTTSQNADAFVQGFTEDCLVQYAPFAEMHGREPLRRFMAKLFAGDRSGFVCNKRLRSISGNVLGVVWVNEWVDNKTQKRMLSKGVEFWVMCGERIARWDAASVFWEA